MPSGLAVGIWVRPVRIRTSLFFRALWSIGCEKRAVNYYQTCEKNRCVWRSFTDLALWGSTCRKTSVESINPLFLTASCRHATAQHSPSHVSYLWMCGEEGGARHVGNFLMMRLDGPVGAPQWVARAQWGDLHSPKQLLQKGQIQQLHTNKRNPVSQAEETPIEHSVHWPDSELPGSLCVS